MTENEFKPCPKCDSRLEMGATCCPVCGWSTKGSVAPIWIILVAMMVCPLSCLGACWISFPVTWSVGLVVQEWWFWPGLVLFFGSVGGLEYWRRKGRK